MQKRKQYELRRQIKRHTARYWYKQIQSDLKAGGGVKLNLCALDQFRIAIDGLCCWIPLWFKVFFKNLEGGLSNLLFDKQLSLKDIFLFVELIQQYSGGGSSRQNHIKCILHKFDKKFY